MQKLAFFDIDGTVFRSSLVVELVEKLVERGLFPEDAKRTYEEELIAWQNREGEYRHYIEAVVRSFMGNIKGLPYSDLKEVGLLVVEEQSKHVYRYTRDLIRRLKDREYFIVAISQSPKAILDAFCASYGFDKVYGRIYELGPQDRLTGEMIDVHLIENKANIVQRVANAMETTLEESVGVGDTEGDISLLESVEQPICFNPNHELYVHAKRMTWPVVVERKDVIYELNGKFAILEE